MRTNIELEPLLAGPRVARALDIGAATMRRWHREGCPSHIIGNGLVRYRLNEVLAWRAQRPPAKKHIGQFGQNKAQKARPKAEAAK